MQQPAIDLECLRSFVMVAERLSFHEAATALRISAPALTRRIQRLEVALDTVLLERSTRLVVPTQEGRLFLQLASEALAAVDRAVDTVRTASHVRSGHLVLACVPTMTHEVLPRIISRFHAQWPERHVRVIECGVDAVVQAVRDGSASFGFSFPIGARIDGDLAFEQILLDPYCLILPPDHELARRDEVRWHDLKPQRVITAGRHSGNMRVLDQALRGIDWRPDAVYEIDHLTTSLGMVQAGLGIAVIPRSALPACPPSTLAVRALTEPRASRRLGIFRRRNQVLPSMAQQFLVAVRRTAAILREQTA